MRAATQLLASQLDEGVPQGSRSGGGDLLMTALDGLSDADLVAPRMTNWGEQWPTWRVLWTMVDHDLHHGGEDGVLRDLYRERNMSQASVPASGAPA